VPYSKAWLTPEGKRGKTNHIASVAAIENSFLGQTVFLDLDYGHEDEAPLLVAIEYITAAEGHFWQKIRGLGLAYGYDIEASFERGYIAFTLAKSSRVGQAYEVAKEIVDALINKKLEIDDTSLSAAKSSTMFVTLSKEENYEMAGLQSLVKYLKKIGPNGNKDLLRKIQKVTKDDIIRILHKYFHVLFDGTSSNLVITTGPGKVDEATNDFEKLGRKLTKVKLEGYFE